MYAIGQGPLPVFSPGTISTLYTPTGVGANSTSGIAKDSAGNIFVSNFNDHTIRKIDTVGTVTVVAGTAGTSGYSGDGGPATSATLNQPLGLAIDGAGNLYIADTNNNRIRMVNSAGIISTIAGNGSPIFAGDGGLATVASVTSPQAVALDLSGNLFIAETGGDAIVRRVDSNFGCWRWRSSYGCSDRESGCAGYRRSRQPLYRRRSKLCRPKSNASGTITTIACVAGTYGFSGDGGLATGASLSVPSGLSVDPAGDVYISDNYNGYIRKIDTQGKISSIAGNGSTHTFSGDGGFAGSAGFYELVGIVLGDDGSIYVADGNIRKITPTASLTFPDTLVGASSASLPLQVFNIGNQEQDLSVLAVSGDFSAAPASTCSSSSPLTNAGGCTVAVVFTPTQPGARTGSVTITPLSSHRSLETASPDPRWVSATRR